MADGSGDGAPLENMSALRHQVDAIRDSRGQQQQQQQPQQQQHPQQPQRSLPSPLQAATHPMPSSTSLSAASSSSSASSLSSSSSSSLSSSSSHQLSQHHHHQTPVNNTNNMRASCNVVAAATSTNLNNASAKQNNVDREVQSQVQLSTSNMVGACAGASCLPPGGSHSTYNYIASNSSNAGLQSKDNRAAFGGMKKGFLENMTNNSRESSSSSSSNVGGGGSGGMGSSNSSSNSNNSGATGGAGASGGCNNKRSNETKNLIDCNQIGSKKTYNKDMPFIKPKNTDVRSSSFELHEELENIREKQTLLNSTEWVTDALLTRLQSNPNLIGRLSDPTFIEAITDFQKNPQSAMAKYQGDKDLQASMQEFCSILGDHLLKLDKKDGTHKPCNLAAATPLQDVAVPSSSSSSSSGGEAASSSAAAAVNHLSSAYMDNEHRMQDLLTDPEIREALVDKKVQEVIAMQNQNPERAQSMLHQGDAELRKKVRKLVDAGLLTFNS